MSALQTGLNMWVDRTGRIPGGDIGSGIQGGALNATPLGTDRAFDAPSASAAVSDVTEVGEMTPTQFDTFAQAPAITLAVDDIDTNSTELHVSEATIASAARQIGVIEAAMRQHQTTGTTNFEDDADTQDPPSEDSSKLSFLSEILQNSNEALAANTPGQNRIWLLSLLS